MNQYIYPQNLKAKATLWLWGMRDFIILCIAALLSVAVIIGIGFLVPMALTLCFGFLTIRVADTTIAESLGYALRFFLSSQQYYEWR